MEWHILKNVQDKESNDKRLVSFNLEKGFLELTILENDVAWTSKIQQELIDTLAQKSKKSSSHYLNRLKELLDSDDVDLKFTQGEFVLQYTLRNNIIHKYLQCKLTKESSMFECISNLLQKLSNENDMAIKEMSSLKEERDQLKESVTELESKLTDFVSRKKKDDDILYSNFVIVLNEKKARIQHLTELLEAFRHGRPTVNPPPKIQKNTRALKKTEIEVKNEVSDSEESGQDYNTDDEKPLVDNNIIDFGNNTNAENMHSSSMDNIPSTSKQHISNTPTNYSCSILEDTSPVHVLPKRMKYDHRIEKTIDPPSYKAHQSKDDENHQKIKMKEDSPIVNYSTQDLLDEI